MKNMAIEQKNYQEYWHSYPIESVVRKLKTNIESGISEKEARERQKIFGKNILPQEKPISKSKIIIDQFRNPLVYILLAAGIVTLFLKEFTNATVIFGAIFLNTVVGFFQEYKTSNILSELKKIVKVKTFVIREKQEKETEQSELVPGDIFFLSAGNKIPADGRIIEAHDLKINEASLTGEWIAAEKITGVLPQKISLADRENMVYMGAFIESGRGKAIATETGRRTEIGKVAVMVKEAEEEKTPYQRKIEYLSKIIGVLIVFISVIIFILGIKAGRESSEMFLTAIAIAVAAIPEGLPVAITVILALGMRRILKKQGLVRKMIAAETLGSTSIICTDKTGTLTEAKMQVAGIYTGTKELFPDNGKYPEKINKNGTESHILALKISMLCTEAFIENSEDALEKWIVRGRPTEKALLLAGIQAGLNKKELEKEQPKIDELFFDSSYKYSATLHKFSKSKNILYVLGAGERILEKSKWIELDGRQKILSKEKIAELNKKYEETAAKGQRIMAAGYKLCDLNDKKAIQDKVNDLIFVGFIALHDPLRKEVKSAIRLCRRAGMRPIIVTGDNKMTAKAIAQELGLPSEEYNIIEGSELRNLSDDDFKKRLEDIEIYARVEPDQKLRIVRAWQERGEIVAMTGDGINDAPSLKKANIGIALGSGTDAAKESSDLILLNDNFSVIVAAVEEGRAIIDNIRKTITLLVSQCFSEIILIGVSILGGLPLPILPVQILWENLIEGNLQGVALAFEPKEKDIMERAVIDHKKPLLTVQMKAIIFGFGIITAFVLSGLFLWLYNTLGEENLKEIRTIIFASLSIDTLFYVFSCRNLRKNIWQYNPFSNWHLMASLLFSVFMLLTAIYLPVLQNFLKTAPLNFFAWKLILGLGLLNLILVEAIKYYFIVRKKHD